MLDSHQMLVEPACGASLAAALSQDIAAEFNDVVVIVCGGVGVTDGLIRKWEESR